LNVYRLYHVPPFFQLCIYLRDPTNKEKVTKAFVYRYRNCVVCNPFECLTATIKTIQTALARLSAYPTAAQRRQTVSIALVVIQFPLRCKNSPSCQTSPVLLGFGRWCGGRGGVVHLWLHVLATVPRRGEHDSNRFGMVHTGCWGGGYGWPGGGVW
jgi:hypothetical protein